MKRIITYLLSLFFLSSFSLGVSAQYQMIVHTDDGNSYPFNVNKVDSVSFRLVESDDNNDEDDNEPERTVLFYIAADNNLTNVANSTVYSIRSGTSSYSGKNNLIVFVDRMNVNPVLLNIHGGQIDTVRVYQELDSTDPSTLRSVIDYVQSEYKTNSYGLVLYSHGTGWLPTSQLHFVAPNMHYAQSRDGKNSYLYQNGLRNPFVDTKAFAWENRNGETPSYKCMEINELAGALPDSAFDFIAFDACYMGNVEIAYALRHKTKKIVSCCYEIISNGFPYHISTPDLLNGDLETVCSEYYNYYDGMSGWERMAGISLVETNGLDSLARCFKKIVAEKKDIIPNTDISNIHCFDRFTNPIFFDLGDFADKLGVSDKLLQDFKAQLGKCVTYKISTPYIFPGDPEQIEVKAYSGLSVYIPLGEYDSSGLNDAYRETEWSMDTGY